MTKENRRASEWIYECAQTFIKYQQDCACICYVEIDGEFEVFSAEPKKWNVRNLDFLPKRAKILQEVCLSEAGKKLPRVIASMPYHKIRQQSHENYRAIRDKNAMVFLHRGYRSLCFCHNGRASLFSVPKDICQAVAARVMGFAEEPPKNVSYLRHNV
jgi:hypothetical protein